MTVISSNADRRHRIADHLNELISICQDGHAGYLAVAQDARDAELKDLFLRLARQREEFAGQLQELVRGLHCQPRQTTSFVGAVHRGWINLRRALAINDSLAALAECERGEDSAVEAYRQVLAEAPLDRELRTLISTQAFAVKDTRDEIRFFREVPLYSPGI